MAGVFSKQGSEQPKNCSKNPNKIKSTSSWLNVWKTWCQEKNVANKIEEHKPVKLNKLLEQFYAENPRAFSRLQLNKFAYFSGVKV